MDKLETLASVLSSLSGSPAVYPLEKPRDADNCIVYRQISNVPYRCLLGNSMFDKTRIQLDIWNTTFAANRALVQIVRNGLDNNQSDFMLSYLNDDVTVKDIDANLFRSILDFYIW